MSSYEHIFSFVIIFFSSIWRMCEYQWRDIIIEFMIFINFLNNFFESLLRLILSSNSLIEWIIRFDLCLIESLIHYRIRIEKSKIWFEYRQKNLDSIRISSQTSSKFVLSISIRVKKSSREFRIASTRKSSQFFCIDFRLDDQFNYLKKD